MTFPKNKLFSEADQSVANISFALSHPARLFITRALNDEGPKVVLELEQMMPLTQGSISFHLNKMLKEGLLSVQEKRLFNEYSLDMKRLEETAKVYEAWYASLRVGG